MSVEISGPQGYEYQYLLTAYIAVSAYIRWGTTCQLIVEALNGEDAELNCEIGTIYIQAKLFKGTLDADQMLRWLEHAPRNNSSLWQRVAEDENRQALIVTSARCNDATSPFQSPIGLTGRKHDTSPLSPRIASDLLEGVAKHDGSRKSTIKQIAKRIIVWEQISPELLLERIKEAITCVGVARSQTVRVIEELLNAIRIARNIRSDCFSEVVSILGRWRDADLVPEPQTIVNREDIDEIESVLLTKGILLLHGRPQCGKTTAARMLLAQMRVRGFEIHIGQDVRDATRVLGTTGRNDIAYLLDDPIGSYESNPALAWESLERFIYHLPPHRYLIITSRTDDLRNLRGDDEVNWRLDNNSWIDLTVTDREFLMAVWRYVSSGLLESVTRMVEQHIMQDAVDSLLQPGQLKHLSRQKNDDFVDISQSMLLSKARFNSRSLAAILTHQGAAIRDVLRVLSLVATHVETTALEDVAYILSDETTYPSEDPRESDFLIFSSFRFNIEEYEPPQYQSIHSLQDIHSEALDTLERQGLIQHDSHRIRFTHPDYSESAIIMREVRTQGDSVALENFHLRAIFSVDPRTACTAAQSLRIERQRRQTTGKSCEYVFAAALRGLRSLYPSVKDVCLEILILGVDELTKDQKSLVWQELDSYYGDQEVINWYEGNPWIIPATERPFKSLGEADIALDFDTPSEQVGTSHATWHTLREKTLTHDKLIQALEKPESFIRREAVLQLMSGNGDIPSPVLDRMLDDHPVVASSAIWVLIENRINPELLVNNKARLVQAAERVGVAIVLRHKFFRTGQRIRFYPAIEAKAEVVLRILQAVLENLPLSIRFTDDTHLDETLENFVRVVPKSKRVEFARLRYSYLVRQLQFYLPEDNGLCVGEFVLKYVPADEPDRYGILQKLLCHRETAVAITTVASCISLWDSMTQNEQDLCTDVLVMNRMDVLWLQAMALTRSRPTPEKILECLGLPKNLFSLSTSEIIDALGSNLTGACIRIYCGVPYPLWFIGLHHSGSSIWQFVVELIACRPGHEHFEYCLDQCLLLACRGEWSCGDMMWRRILERVDNEQRKQLIEMLFERMVKYNGAMLSDYWRHVFEVIREQDYLEVISKISQRIDLVQYYYEDLRDFISLFGEKAFNDILESFPEDTLLMRVWLEVNQDKLSIEDEEVLKFILWGYRTEPPRLLFVHRCVENLVEDVSTEISAIVEAAKKATQKQVTTVHAAYRASTVSENIQDWYFCERINS